MFSVGVFIDFLVVNSKGNEALRESSVSATCPFESPRPLAEDSVSLPLLTGDGCRLGKVPAIGVSILALTETAAPGLDLPADSGLFGSVVLKFDGVSSEKSGGTIGWGVRLTGGSGELGRDIEATVLPLVTARLEDADITGDWDIEGAVFLRVGVEALDVDRGEGELKFAGIWGLELGVEGLEFWDGLEVVFGAGQALEGVEGLDNVGREVGVEFLAEDEERLEGVEDRI